MATSNSNDNVNKKSTTSSNGENSSAQNNNRSKENNTQGGLIENMTESLENNTLFILKLLALTSLLLGEFALTNSFPAIRECNLVFIAFLFTVMLLIYIFFVVVYQICRRDSGRVLCVLVVMVFLLVLSDFLAVFSDVMIGIFAFFLMNRYVIYSVECKEYTARSIYVKTNYCASYILDLLFYSLIWHITWLCMATDWEDNDWMVFIMCLALLLVCIPFTKRWVIKIPYFSWSYLVLYSLFSLYWVYGIWGNNWMENIKQEGNYVIVFWLIVLILIPAYFFAAFFVEEERHKILSQRGEDVIDFLSTIGLILSALGFYITFYSETFVQADDMKTVVMRMFDEKGNGDHRFSTESVADTIPHLVFVLDVSGSGNKKLPAYAKEEIKKMRDSIKREDVVKKCDTITKFFDKWDKGELTKSLGFGAKALYQLSLLRKEKFSLKVSLITFGEEVEVYEMKKIVDSVGIHGNDSLLSVFNFICKTYLDAPTNAVNYNHTNFLKLFNTMGNFITSQAGNKNTGKNPNRISTTSFLIFSDFINDPEAKDSIPWKRSIIESLKEFNRKSQYASFLYYDDDIEQIEDGKYAEAKFSVIPLMKAHLDKESYSFYPLTYGSERYPLDIVWLNRRFPFYYKSAFTHPRLKSQLVLDSLVCRKFRVSIASGNEYPKHYFYGSLVDSMDTSLKWAGKNGQYDSIFINHVPQTFCIDSIDQYVKKVEHRDSCKLKLALSYFGPIPNQFPNYTLVLENMDKRICYKMNIVFFREFHPYAKYYLYLFFVLISSLILYKFLRIQSRRAEGVWRGRRYWKRGRKREGRRDGR